MAEGVHTSNPPCVPTHRRTPTESARYLPAVCAFIASCADFRELPAAPRLSTLNALPAPPPRARLSPAPRPSARRLGTPPPTPARPLVSRPRKSPFPPWMPKSSARRLATMAALAQPRESTSSLLPPLALWQSAPLTISPAPPATLAQLRESSPNPRLPDAGCPTPDASAAARSLMWPSPFRI